MWTVPSARQYSPTIDTLAISTPLPSEDFSNLPLWLCIHLLSLLNQWLNTLKSYSQVLLMRIRYLPDNSFWKTFFRNAWPGRIKYTHGPPSQWMKEEQYFHYYIHWFKTYRKRIPSVLNNDFKNQIHPSGNFYSSGLTALNSSEFFWLNPVSLAPVIPLAGPSV